MTDIDYERCELGPFPPTVSVNLGNRTRLALEIAENDNGEIEFEEYDPQTGERVEEAA